MQDSVRLLSWLDLRQIDVELASGFRQTVIDACFDESSDYWRRRLHRQPSGRALQKRATVRILDNLRTGDHRRLERPRVDFVEASVLDTAALRSALSGVEVVFHLAAMVGVQESMDNPRGCVETNVIGTLNVLEAAAAAGVRKLVFASSAAIYGDDPPVPTSETASPTRRALTRSPSSMASTSAKCSDGRDASKPRRFVSSTSLDRDRIRRAPMRLLSRRSSACDMRRTADDLRRWRTKPRLRLCE